MESAFTDIFEGQHDDIPEVQLRLHKDSRPNRCDPIYTVTTEITLEHSVHFLAGRLAISLIHYSYIFISVFILW